MTDKRISELTAMAGADVAATSDVIAIVDTSENTTKKITRQNFLSTALQSSVTDTTAGLAMIVGAFGLGSTGTAERAPSNNINNLALTGFYRYDSDTTGAPNTAGVLHHLNRISTSGAGGAIQVAYSNVGDIRIRYLTGVSPNTWTGWRPVYNGNNVVGPVSQSSGVPTGAVIERGSNANGEYVRFADGTQMCWITLFATAVSAAAAWTYPAAFSGDSPVVTGVPNLNAARMITIFNRTLTNCEVYSWDDTGSGAVNPNASLTAVGRWF